MAEKLIGIDGSIMEGGGQILRTSSALSILTQKPVRIYNIRSGRPQPGLRTQHLRGLEAISDLSGGRIEGAKLGSKDIFFYPGKITETELDIHIETAGSIGLVLQSLLLASLHNKKKLVINITGGATYAKFAPPLEYIQFVLLPILRQMGYHTEINIIEHGFFPVGGAKVKVMINPPEKLIPIELRKPGKVKSVDIVSTASSQLKNARVAERQARTAEELLTKRGYFCKVKVRYSETRCAGSGMVIVVRRENGCLLGSSAIGERGVPAEAVAEIATSKALFNIDSGAMTDEYLSDQILPYMAFAEGNSSFSTPILTDHTKTNIFIIEQFMPVEFGIAENLGRIEIKCEKKEN